jgi:RNase E specificity factor CsrD
VAPQRQSGLEPSAERAGRCPQGARRFVDSFIRRNVFIDKQLGIGNRLFFDNRFEAAMSNADYSIGAVMLLEFEGVESILRQEGEARAIDWLQRCSELIGHFLQRHAGAIQGRYSGHLLAILLPGFSKQETLTAAEQLLNLLQRLGWPESVVRSAACISAPFAISRESRC